MLPSSQAFAFNLFLPFADGSARTALSKTVARAIGRDFQLDHIDLEWVPPGPLLGEIPGDRPVGGEPATGVDAVLWGTSGDEPAAVLVEVKLSEKGFTHCGGAASKGNHSPEACASGLSIATWPNR